MEFKEQWYKDMDDVMYLKAGPASLSEILQFHERDENPLTYL